MASTLFSLAGGQVDARSAIVLYGRRREAGKCHGNPRMRRQRLANIIDGHLSVAFLMEGFIISHEGHQVRTFVMGGSDHRSHTGDRRVVSE
jgi:hypothetical protein